MKKLIIIAAFAAVACNPETKPKEEIASSTTTDSTNEAISYPYTATYSSKFEIGNPEYAKVVLNLWKDFDDNNLDNSLQSFADSVSMDFSDGSRVNGKRDSVVADAKKFRGSYKEVKTEVIAFMPLRTIDKNEDWVSVWGKEHRTDLKGKKDSVLLHEIWAFDKDGKITRMYQFAAKIPKN